MGVFSRLKRNRTRQAHSSVESSSPFAAGRLLFVSHEATRTGAPKIILNILRHFRQKTNANLQTILHHGGFLAEEFGQYSEVDCLNVARESSELLTKRIRRLCNRYKNDPPVLAICNSMESRYIAYELKKLNIPILFLVHELPSSYHEDDYRRIYDCSERVIFPVNTVQEAADQVVPIPTNKGMVLSQGLLNPEFGTRMDRSTAYAQIRRELSIPHDSLVALGCGTLDLRKGIDQFASVARLMLAKRRVDRPIHFVWLGEGPRWTHSPYHYVMMDVRNGPARGHVHFIGERDDVEPFFLGADTFLMTSRVDPFPCVIHEAMAAELPIITFDQSGGAATAVQDGAGLVVPFGDVEAMADMMVMLANQPSIAEGLRKRGRERVSTHYQFDQYVDQLIRLAEQTANRKFFSGEAPILTTEPPAADTDLMPWTRAA